MSIMCRLAERALARAEAMGQTLDPGSSLGRHLAACERCQAFGRTCARLSADLPISLECPGPSEDFVTRVLARAERQPVGNHRRSWRSGLTLAACLAAAGLAVAYLLRPPAPQTAPHGPSQAGPVVAEARAPAPVPEKASTHDLQAGRLRYEEPKRSESATPARPRKAEGDAMLRIMLRARRRMASAPDTPAAKVAGTPSNAAAGASAVPSQTAAQVTWLEWGAYCEANADYRQAAAAYARASQEHNDPDITFAAGRAAEAAGDVVGAVEQYGRLLGASASASEAEASLES